MFRDGGSIPLTSTNPLTSTKQRFLRRATKAWNSRYRDFLAF
ncbi:hypothetical protein FHR53_003033 [Xanthomonas arboricola]